MGKILLDMHSHIDQNGNTWHSSVFVSDDWTKWISDLTIEEIEKLFKSQNRLLNIAEGWSWNAMLMEIIMKVCSSRVNSLIWIDIDATSIEVGKARIKKLWDEINWKCTFILSNLFQSVTPKLLKNVDILYFCFPQLFATEELEFTDKRPDDFYAHYVERWANIGPFYDVWYWLIRETLKQFRAHNDEGITISNFTWRVNPDIVEELHNYAWYDSEIWLERIIPHCKSTNLWALVQLEKSTPELVWKMYGDINWKEVITIEEAEDRRKQWIEVFHDLLVVKWIPKKS